MSPALQAWSNVGNHLSGIGADYRSLVDSDAGGSTGLIVDAYRAATVFREGTNVSTDLVVTLGKGTTGADIP